MDIEKTLNGTELIISLTGRLNTSTAPALEAEMKRCLSGISALIMDLSGLEYLSSAGLRVLMATQDVMDSQGSMSIRNVNDTIMEVFEVTGLTDILTIE